MTTDHTPEARASERLRTRVEEKLRPLTLPNFITLVRLAIVPFFVLAVLERDYRLATWILLVAGLSDVLDGWLARSLQAKSLFGAYLDPVTDKVLLVTAYVALTIPHGQAITIPLWLATLALFRDFLIMLVALILFLTEHITAFPPSALGKATTFFHVVTVAAVLLANLDLVEPWLLRAVFLTAFALVILSGFNYIYRASKFIEAARQRAKEDRGNDATCQDDGEA